MTATNESDLTSIRRNTKIIKMTNAQKNIRTIKTFLDQHLDGYVIIGFNPLDQEPVLHASVPDAKDEVALNALLGGVLSNNGVGALRDQIKEMEKEGEE